MPKPIETEWRSFCKASFADDLQWTHPQQYIDLRRTFYGGVAALLGILMKSLSPGDEITEADLQMVRDASKELQEFIEALKRGAA
jgi:hypothetical protein